MSDEILMLELLVRMVLDLLRTMSPLEAVGAGFGVLGTALLALNCRWSGLGFPAYLVSNVALIVFFKEHGHGGLLLMQVVFTLFSLVGIWQWLLGPFFERLGAWVDEQVDWGDPR